ncbi:unnamed protein product, partial [Pelagomonas calceolata]
MYNSLTVSLAPLPLLGCQFLILRRRSRRETLSLAPSRPQQRRRRAVEERPDEVRRVAVRRTVDVVAALAEVEVPAVLVEVEDLDDGHAALRLRSDFGLEGRVAAARDVRRAECRRPDRGPPEPRAVAGHEMLRVRLAPGQQHARGVRQRVAPPRDRVQEAHDARDVGVLGLVRAGPEAVHGPVVEDVRDARAGRRRERVRRVEHRRDAPEPRDAEEPHRVHAQASASPLARLEALERQPLVRPERRPRRVADFLPQVRRERARIFLLDRPVRAQQLAEEVVRVGHGSCVAPDVEVADAARRKPRRGLAGRAAAGVVVVRVPEPTLRFRRRLEAVRARLMVDGAAPLVELGLLIPRHAAVRGGELRRPPERDALMRQHAALALREVDLHRRGDELRRRRRVRLHPFSCRVLVLPERPEADALGGSRREEQGQPSVAHRAAPELRRLGGLAAPELAGLGSSG